MDRLAFILSLLFAHSAVAHIALDFPPARTGDQKVEPCGSATAGRGSTFTTFPPGATITVRWRETIDHPSHYRISFDDEGDDDFYTPTGFEDVNPDHPTVLADGIDDAADRTDFEATVTLPNSECDGCTLQLIQLMKDKSPYGDGNDLYYQCADIVLREGADPAGEISSLTGCACVRPSRSAATVGLAFVLVVGGALVRRRADDRRYQRPL